MTQDGDTPLKNAAAKGHSAVVDLLKSHGAKVGDMMVMVGWGGRGGGDAHPPDLCGCIIIWQQPYITITIMLGATPLDGEVCCGSRGVGVDMKQGGVDDGRVPGIGRGWWGDEVRWGMMGYGW